ncbi:MAG: DUF4928 family protein [Acidobacteria bacterium]|nr:DUF4928 family protein [Acidobacteriota bacterium]
MSIERLISKSLEVLKEWYDGERPSADEPPDRYVVCAALALLERMREVFPLREEGYITEGNQVRTGGPQIKAILGRFGENRTYSKEGGRTTRGTRPAAERFADWLNGVKEISSLADSERKQVAHALQEWLVEHPVKEFFSRQRISVEINLERPGPQIVSDLLKAAVKKKVAGAVAQHLVGAKLSLRFPHLIIGNFSFTTADEQLGRHGDFVIGDTVFHVTFAPMPPVVDKCNHNLRNGYRSIILVPESRVPAAVAIADQVGLKNRIGILSIESFVGQNLEEMGEFSRSGLAANVESLLKKYNERVKQAETDHSILIEIPENLQ